VLTNRSRITSVSWELVDIEELQMAPDGQVKIKVGNLSTGLKFFWAGGKRGKVLCGGEQKGGVKWVCGWSNTDNKKRKRPTQGCEPKDHDPENGIKQLRRGPKIAPQQVR